MASKKTPAKKTVRKPPAKKTAVAAGKTTVKRVASARKKPAATKPVALPAVDESELLAASANDFIAEALERQEGLERAASVLEQALAAAELTDTDAWLERALAPYHLDFVFELAGDQHALLQTAGTLLLKLRHPASAGRLLERLQVGFLKHDADRYPLYLIGRLGSPDLVPDVSAWFIGRPVKSIAHYGFPLYRLMCDLLVRQQSREVVEHIRKMIDDHDAGRVGLSKHHRYAYDTALAAITGAADHRWQPAPIQEPPQ